MCRAVRVPELGDGDDVDAFFAQQLGAEGRAETLQADNDILTSELQAAKDEAGEQSVTHAG